MLNPPKPPARQLSALYRLAFAAMLATPAYGQTATSALGASLRDARAIQVSSAPTLDGRAGDIAWDAAQPLPAFQTFVPSQGNSPTYATEVRVVYDERTLFVLVRAFDPHPDSIVGVLSRRDNFGPPSDLVQLYLDTYHDGRSGYEYIVNPAGVKSDFLLFEDSGFDLSWNGVWDAAVGVDSLGWVAEFAIPFSQLRFRQKGDRTFGIMVWRTIGRLGEKSSYPRYDPNVPGRVSQLAALDGFSNLPTHARLEVAPYTLGRARNAASAGTGSLRTETQAGADLKYGPSPNVTLDATVNPDFGQVESDPAVLNLTGFETFLPEQRPFFLEGAGLFRLVLSRDPNSPEGMFYTRRIGRAPTLLSQYGDAGTPIATPILGAGKVTGRVGSVSLASLAALTEEVRGAPTPGGGRWVVEPRTAYAMTRVQREFRAGRSNVSAMVTDVARAQDSLTASVLANDALGAAVLAQHQSADGQWMARGWAAHSRITGRPAAITRLQLMPTHAFQRPDDGIPLDTTLTEMSGSAAQLWMGKVGGRIRFGTSYRTISRGFDANDMGYTTQADHRSFTVDAGFASTHPTRWYRNAQLSVIHIWQWSGVGQIERMVSPTLNLELPTQWRLRVSPTVAQLAGTVCAQRCTRGGPAIRKDPLATLLVQLYGDTRPRFAPNLGALLATESGGRSWQVQWTPGVTGRVASNLMVDVGALIEQSTNDAQFYRRFGDATSDTAHYTVARLQEGTRALTTRVSYAATPTVSVEWYAQPYIARGSYANVRELSQPRAARYADRFMPYPDTAITANPGGVDFRQFRSNLVGRWEYRPGSVLYVVWTQGRDRFADDPGRVAVGRDARELFELAPRNTIAIKASYWLSR